MQRETGRGRQIRRVVVATNNAGKVRELQEALAPLGWQCEGLGSVTLPEETGSTYEENAALKACAAAMATGLPALAEPCRIQTAQVQIGVCGVPPLPPCERPGDRYERRGGPIVGRPAPDDDEDLGVVCRTRTLQCRVGRPRPIGGRCTCEDDEGEAVVGRIIR